MKKISQNLLILSLITSTLFLINLLVFTISTAKEKLYTNKAHYYQWKFGRIFYTVQGTGKSVLLVHNSSIQSSSYEFHRIVNALSKQYKVYTLDLIGYGQSDKPKITYTAYLFVQLLIDFQKDIIQEKASIVTSGKSNMFATMACYQKPKIFKNLIFINPANLQTINHNPTSKDKLLKFILELPIIGTSIFNCAFSRLNISKNFREDFYDNSRIRNSYIDAFVESSHLSGSASKFIYASCKSSFINVNIQDALSYINNTISIIQGNRLGEYKEIIGDYKSVNEAIESSSIDRTKSLPHLERPESTLELLSIYLH